MKTSLFYLDVYTVCFSLNLRDFWVTAQPPVADALRIAEQPDSCSLSGNLVCALQSGTSTTTILIHGKAPTRSALTD
jgi:hypothetical protein